MIGVMILTHGRAGYVATDATLKRCGWTGPVHYVVDDEDDDIDEYRRLYGPDRVHVFSKDEEQERFDVGDLSEDRRTIVYARNASQRIARELGWDYMWQFDDDYTDFQFKYAVGGTLKHQCIKGNGLDRIAEILKQFLERTNALTVALGQGGDYIGGFNTTYQKGLLRKAMNSFLIRTDRPIRFVGRINEDVNTYVSLGNRGELLFTVMDAMLVQKTTQSNAGGMTGAYLAAGTYLKSFHTVMRNPSSVKIGLMGDKHMRIRHKIDWRRTVPCILSEDLRREA